MHLLLCQYHAVSISVALQYRLKSDSKIAPAILFFFIIVLATWGLFCFHTKFKNICPMSVKNVWVYIQRKQNTNLRRSINTNLHSSIIYNSQVMEATLVSINRWMDKEDKVYVYIYIYIYIYICMYVLSRIWLSVIPWTVDHQPPLSMQFSRQEYWSGFPFPIPGYLPDSGIKPTSLASPGLAGEFFTYWPPGKPQLCMHVCVYTYAYRHIHNRILLRPKKSWSNAICNNLDGPRRYYV